MKKINSFSLIALTWILFGSLSCTEKGKPEIFCKTKSLDLGKVKVHETKTGFFTIENTGDAELIVKKIEASCSCTKVKIDRTKIPPSERARIYFNFKSAVSGENTNRILLRNNSEDEFYFLEFTAEVVAD